MRLTSKQVTGIRSIIRELAGEEATVRLFGSRIYDDLRGGDVDLLVELPYPVASPALLAARLAGRISRFLDERNVDVVLAAPNLLRLPIHEVARQEGILL